MRSGTTRARWQATAVVALALLAGLGVARGALAQAPADPEAAVAMYRVWFPDDLTNRDDGTWLWDQGIPASDAAYYFNHDRTHDTLEDPDGSNVWTYRWGDQVQIVIELSLPIHYRTASLDNYVMDRTTYATDPAGIDYFTTFLPAVGTLPSGATISRVYLNPIEMPSGAVNPAITVDYPAGGGSWQPHYDAYGRLDGIDWSLAPVTTNVEVDDGTGATPLAIPGDVEPGSAVLFPIGAANYRMNPIYHIVVNIPEDGDVIYPNPRSIGVAGGANPLAPAADAATIAGTIGTQDPRLCYDDLVVDWIRPQPDAPLAGQALNDALATDPGRNLINPNFLPGEEYDPQNDLAPRQITSAAIELVGPDLDPLTPGAQSPRWTIANGRLAVSRPGSVIPVNMRDRQTPWLDVDQVPCIRWDERTVPVGTPFGPDTAPTGPGAEDWKRIVRLVFGGTGYPGSRGWNATTNQTREGQYQNVDDPDAFVIGPQPGMRYASTQAERYDNTGGTAPWDIFGLLLSDRTYARDPFGGAVTSTGAKLDNPFTPGFWKVANVTLTVSPDPNTPTDPDSFRTLVVPVYPKAPWNVPDPGSSPATGADVNDQATWPALPETEKAYNWFVVENPLDLQVARGDEQTPAAPDAGSLAGTIGAGRFGFVGNPGSHADQRPTSGTGALAGDEDHRYYLAQGNHDFPSLLDRSGAEADPTAAEWDARYWFDGGLPQWRRLAEDWDNDGDPVSTDAALPGWSPPLIDLGAGTPGQSLGWGRAGDNRGNDGLWLSNTGHVSLYRSVGRALEQTGPDDGAAAPTWAVDPNYGQEDGPGTVRVEIPPLRPVVTTTDDNWTDDNPDVEAETADARDYADRSLPNGSYPSIPGTSLRLTVRGRDLSADGLPALTWSRSDATRTAPVSAETPWAAADNRSRLRDNTTTRGAYTATPRGPADTLAPERVGVVLEIPVHQPAMASADDGDWREPTGPLEIVHDPPQANYAPITYYATADPDDPNVPTWSGPGVDRTDHQAGTATLTYPDVPAAGDPAEPRAESFMVKVYVDVNGNGKLDLPRPDLAAAAYGSGANPTDPFWYRYLYAEPYRCVAVRAKVLPSYELAAGRRVIDFGIYGHADPRGYDDGGGGPLAPWQGLPAWDDLSAHERSLGLTSRGNFPLGLFGAADGTPGVAEIGLTARSALGYPAWLTDEAEQGVCVPIERLLPNYLLEGAGPGDPTWDLDTTGWSFLPAPAGAAADAGKPYVDGLVGGRNGAPDPGEEVGARATADILGAGTPLGTYWLDSYTYMDMDGVAGYDPTADRRYGEPIACKATVKESPLAPLTPLATREAGKDADLGADSGPDNANTTFGELGPAFLVNTWDDPGGVPNVIGGDYGDSCVFFTSNRPNATSPAGGPESLPWRIWAQRYDWNFTPGNANPLDQYRPVQPTYQPEGEAFLIADEPTAALGVTPPEARFSVMTNYRAYPPAITSRAVGPIRLAVLTWTLEVEWSEDPAALPAGQAPEIRKTYYVGGCLVDTAAGTMGDLLAGPVYIRSDSGIRFGPKPVIQPRAGAPGVFDLYVFHYLGSGTQRRLGYMRWDLDLAAPALTYVGSHELPIMTRYGSGTIRLDGLEYAKDVSVFSDVWCDVSAPGGPVWHEPDNEPTIGVVFAGRSRTFQTQDIFYTRFDPSYPTGGPLSDPATYNPTNNNTGQVPFPERTTDLVPLRQEALAAGQPAGSRAFAAYASLEWVDWVWDPDNAVGFAVSVGGGPTWGPQAWSPGNPTGWREDPISGYLYATNANGGRVVEVDPTVGLVRFVDDTVVPGEGDAVSATFTPQTRRLTRASQDSAQPTVAILTDETIDMPLQPAAQDASVTITPPPVRQAVGLPLRMLVFYKRFDTRGRVRLLYETFSMPYSYPGAPAPPAAIDQVYWTKVTNPDPDALGLPPGSQPYPVISYPIQQSNTAGDVVLQDIPFYVDRPATQTPLEETVGELYVAAQPVQYTWYTDERNIGPPGNVSTEAPPFVALGGTLGVAGPAGGQTLRQVVGPRVCWFMFTSTSEKLPALVAPSGPPVPSEDWTNRTWGIFGGGEQSAFGYDADWDMYFAVLSPQAIPRTSVLLRNEAP